MKRLLVLVVAFGIAGAVQAQGTSLSSEKKKVEKVERDEKSPEERAKMRARQMTKDLGLSPEQEKAVYEVLLSQANERERHQLQREEARKRAEAERQRSEKKILEILNEDQRLRYEKRKAEIKEKRVQHRAEYQKHRPSDRVTPEEKSEENER